MTPAELEELAAADEAERIARESWKPFVPLGSAPSDEGAFATPGSVVKPKEASIAKSAAEREPSSLHQYVSQLGSNLATAAEKTGLTALGGQALGFASDLGESIGTLRRYPARVAGNLMAGETPFKGSEAAGAKSDLLAPLRRLAYWNNPMMVPEPKTGQGLSGQTINESVEALSGPFESKDGKVGLKPDVSAWDAARMIGGGLAGLSTEVLSMPGDLLPGVGNPAEALASKAVKFASKEVAPLATPPGLMTSRRGVLRLGKGENRPKDLAFKTIVDAADELAGVKVHDSPNIPQKKQDALDAMLGPVYSASDDEIMRLASLDPTALKQTLRNNLRLGSQEARRATPTGQAEDVGVMASTQTERVVPRDLVNPEVQVTTRAPRGFTAQDRDLGVKEVMAKVGSHTGPLDEASPILSDLNHNLDTKGTADVLRQLGGKGRISQNNKAENIAAIREILERKVAGNETPKGATPAELEDLAAAKLAEDVNVFEPDAPPATAQAPGGPPSAVPAPAPSPTAPGGGAPQLQQPKQPAPPAPIGPGGPTGYGKPVNAGLLKKAPVAPPPPPAAKQPKQPIPQRNPEPVDIPETPEYAGGLFKAVADRVKRWTNVPAMQEHAARARQVIGDVTSWAARELPGTGKSVLRNLAEAYEGMVDNRWVWNRAKGPKEAVKQVLRPVASAKDPDLIFYNVTASVDDYARSAVGAPRVASFSDPAATKFRDAIRVATSDTGQAFQDAGMYRHGDQGVQPFVHDPLIGRVPHHLIDQPWMHPGNPEAVRFINKVKRLPGNEKFDPADFWRDLEAYRLDPERPVAAEFTRNLKTLPDVYRGSDGTEWKINRAIMEFMPNSSTRGSLPSWYTDQLKRAMVVKQYGQRGFVDELGNPHPSVLDHMTDIMKQVQQNVAAATGDVVKGDDAARDAEQLFSVLSGQRKLGGYYDFRKLGRMGLIDKLTLATANTWASLKLSAASVKQAAQTLQETVARSPDVAGIPRAAAKLSYELPRAFLGESLRLLSSLGGETGAANRLRGIAESISPSSTHELSDAGMFVDDLMTGGLKAFESLGSPMTARRPAAAPTNMWETLTYPFRKLKGVDPNEFINATLSVPAMTFDGLFKMTTRVNNVVNKRMGDFYVERYKQLAAKGLDEAAAIRLRQQNVSEDLVTALQQGRQLTPDETARLGAQIPVQATKQAQIQPRGGEEVHRMFNDKVGHAFQMFKSYVYANGRFLEDHVNLIRSIKDHPNLSASEKTKQISGELVRATARIAGMQAAGELERELARRAGRENSVLEETVPGRILANLLYASYFGPLYLIADTLSYHAGVQRPHAMRDGKEQKPFDIIDLPTVEAANSVIEMGGAALGAPVRAAAPDLVRENFDEEKDSATARATRAAAAVPAVKQVLSEVVGPEAAKEMRTAPRKARTRREELLDDILGGKPKGRRDAVLGDILKGLDVPTQKKRGKRDETLDAILNGL